MTICQKLLTPNDEWIQERTGIQERRHIIRGEDTTTTMGVKAAEVAIARSGLAKKILILSFLLH
jgi:3-oxoacyl-[acyl-carrier-protein] synthase-3